MSNAEPTGVGRSFPEVIWQRNTLHYIYWWAQVRCHTRFGWMWKRRWPPLSLHKKWRARAGPPGTNLFIVVIFRCVHPDEIALDRRPRILQHAAKFFAVVQDE